ncbi:hypothetical protein B4586_05315 [Lacticaseibacillus paracasei]|nr:hypothetical protein B4586_05315 [Lacticaseibacillus paracasei]
MGFVKLNFKFTSSAYYTSANQQRKYLICNSSKKFRRILTKRRQIRMSWTSKKRYGPVSIETRTIPLSINVCFKKQKSTDSTQPNALLEQA